MADQRDFVKVTIRLNAGDPERLGAYYPKLGYNAAIRKLVSEHLKRLDAKFHSAGHSDAFAVEISDDND